MEAELLDRSIAEPEQNTIWPALVIPRERIEAEIARLAAMPLPASGSRETTFVHPMAVSPGRGLAPGIDVTLLVVAPGERTTPRRDNATRVSLVIAGQASASVHNTIHQVGLHDVWNTPGMQVASVTNTGADVFAALVYSNTPVLRKLEVFYEERNVELVARGAEETSQIAARQGAIKRAKDSLPPIPISEAGAALLSYEHLIDIDVVPSRSLHWPYGKVSSHFDEIRNLDSSYTGRRVFVLYNPATERRNGTTHSFFATMAAAPGGGMDKLHRHNSAAINYYIEGSGYSVVDGQRLTWKAGDLQLSAPGWAAHAHGSDTGGGVVAMTIQDHPFHIANDSLIWQEDVDGGPVLNLGSEIGFQTNIHDLRARTAAGAR